jgi:hypothetical protein
MEVINIRGRLGILPPPLYELTICSFMSVDQRLWLPAQVVGARGGIEGDSLVPNMAALILKEALAYIIIFLWY